MELWDLTSKGIFLLLLETKLHIPSIFKLLSVQCQETSVSVSFDDSRLHIPIIL